MPRKSAKSQTDTEATVPGQYALYHLTKKAGGPRNFVLMRATKISPNGVIDEAVYPQDYGNSSAETHPPTRSSGVRAVHVLPKEHSDALDHFIKETGESNLRWDDFTVAVAALDSFARDGYKRKTRADAQATTLNPSDTPPSKLPAYEKPTQDTIARAESRHRRFLTRFKDSPEYGEVHGLWDHGNRLANEHMRATDMAESFQRAGASGEGKAYNIKAETEWKEYADRVEAAMTENRAEFDALYDRLEDGPASAQATNASNITEKPKAAGGKAVGVSRKKPATKGTEKESAPKQGKASRSKPSGSRGKVRKDKGRKVNITMG